MTAVWPLGIPHTGCGTASGFFTVTLPLVAPGIISGVILAFARSLEEFGATITFVSNIPGETRTLPLALYALTQMPDGESGAMRICLLSVAIGRFAQNSLFQIQHPAFFGETPPPDLADLCLFQPESGIPVDMAGGMEKVNGPQHHGPVPFFP